MDGLLFLLSLVGIGLVMWWVIQNDSAGPGDPTTGIFAMPTPRGVTPPGEGQARQPGSGESPIGTGAADPARPSRRFKPRGVVASPPRSR